LCPVQSLSLVQIERSQHRMRFAPQSASYAWLNLSVLAQT